MAKGDAQRLLDELNALDKPQTAMEALNAPPKVEEATAAPIASGIDTYLGNRALRSLMGEGTASLIGLAVPEVKEAHRAWLGRVGVPEQAPPIGSRGATKALGNIVAGTADPVNLIGGGAGVKGVAGNLAARVVESGVAALGGEVGGQIGGSLGGDTGQLIGGVAGGVTGGVTGTRAAMIGKGTVKGATSLGKRIMSGKDMEDATNYLGDTYIANIFKHATLIDKNFPKQLDKAIIESGQVGVDLPILSLVDNPAIVKAVDHLMATNADFRGAYKDQWDKAKAVVDKRNQSFFGDPFEAAKSKLTSTIPAAGKAVDKRVATLDQKIRGISEAYDINPDKRGLGEQLTTLIDKRHDEAIKAAAPDYRKAFDFAAANNVELKPEDTEALYKFVSDERNKDVFAKFPRLYAELQQVFSPATKEAFAFNPTTLELSPQAVPEFSGQSIEVLDSLKRRLNQDIRKARGKEGEELLQMFKEQLDTAINNSSPEFSSLYKAADSAYFKNVGIPFNSETAKAMSRAKFDEQVVPMITRNTSMLSEMLKATGDEGVDIAEAAFMDRFSRAVDPQNKGIIDPVKAQKWLKENDASLNLLPSLKERLTSDTLSVADLQKSKDTLRLNFARAKANDILSGEGLTPNQIINKSVADPAYLTKVLKKYKGTESLEALRAVALDDLLSYKSPMEAFNDRDKAAFYNRIFEGRLESIKRLASISDKLSKFTPEDIAFRFETAIPKDKFQEATGVTSSSAFSTIRSKVMGNIQKVFHLSSQVLNARGAEAQQRKLAEVLLDPKGINTELESMIKFADGQELSVEEIKTLVKKVRKFAVGTPVGNARAGYIGASTQATDMDKEEQGKPLTAREALKLLEESK